MTMNENTVEKQTLRFRLAEAIDAFYQTASPDIPPYVYKLVVFGNSGRGKSLLCNLVVGRTIFEHRATVTSVTAESDFALIPLPGVGTVVVMNVPGLIESDEANLERNQKAIEAAMRVLPDAATVILLVSRDTGGRLSDEDMVAFHTLLDFVPQVPARAIAHVHNAVDAETFDSAEHLAKWKDEMRAGSAACLRGQVLPDRVIFVDKLSKAARTAVDTNPDARHSTEQLRHCILTDLLPNAIPLVPVASPLRLDSVAIKAAMVRLKAKGEELGERFAAERREAELQHERTLRQLRERHQREADGLASVMPAPVVAASALEDGTVAPENENAAASAAKHGVTRADPTLWQRTLPSMVPCDFRSAEAMLRCSPAEALYKIIVLGVSGAGKSFLCNHLMQSECFPHRNQPDVVTNITTAAAKTFPEEGTAVVVYDTRPTLAPEPTAAAMNVLAVRAALSHLPRATTTTLVFVFSAIQGRLSADDLAAANAVLEYVNQGSEQVQTCVVVVNRVDLDADVNRYEYKAAVCHMIRKTLKCRRIAVHLSPTLPKPVRFDDSMTPMAKAAHVIFGIVAESDPLVTPPADATPLVLHSTQLTALVEATRRDMNAKLEAHRQQLAALDEAQRLTERQRMQRREAEMDKAMADLVAVSTAQPSYIVVQRRKPRGILQRVLNFFFGDDDD